MPQASTDVTCPLKAPVPTQAYDAASEKNASARTLALVRLTPWQHFLIDHPDGLMVGLPLAKTLMNCLALQLYISTVFYNIASP